MDITSNYTLSQRGCYGLLRVWGAREVEMGAGASKKVSAEAPSAVKKKNDSIQRSATAKLAAPRAEPYGVLTDAQKATTYDVIVIGGGPVGCAAAQHAAFLGRSALLVDDPKGLDPHALDLSFGGPTGLFSKALRDSAKSVDVEALRRLEKASDKDIWSRMLANVSRSATNNAATQVQLLEGMKVPYLRARAVVVPGGEAITATLADGSEMTIKASHILVATGSSPTRSPAIPFDDASVFDSDSIAKLAFLPRRVAIAGAGIIALEFAKIFSKLGCSVTMIVRGEAAGSLRRVGLDESLVKGLLDDLSESGVTVLEHTSAASFTTPTAPGKPMVVELSGVEGKPPPPSRLECDAYMAAMGRYPNTKGLGLEEAGASLLKGGVLQVDPATYRCEGAPTVYGAGDVIGPPSLASTGVEQAKAAIASMFGEESAVTSRDNFPVGVWTIPEIGYYGLTQQAAAKKDMDTLEGVAPYTACLRGRVFAPQGLLKLVFERASGRIVGVHIIGSDACELIHFGMELVNSGRTIFDVLSSVFTAVTFHELFKFAALDGNAKLSFGMQWRTIFRDLGEAIKTSGSDLTTLRQKFNEIDSDGSGQLDAEELGKLIPVSVGTLSNMVRLADKDGSGTISFEEFAEIVSAL